MIPFAEISHLTFDCYGTLINWERGILDAVLPPNSRHERVIAPDDILRSYVKHEARLEAGPWRLYREILRGVMKGIADDFEITLSVEEQSALVNSLPHWPPFADTVEALQRLAARYKLVILSNTDDALFAETAKTLKVSFEDVITAEQVESYKPGLAHFQEALRRLKVPAGKILHVAQSLYHDHVPARQLGFHTARVNRPSLLAGTGLAPGTEVEPEITVPDLRTLAERIA
jgi:2-haloacid dehalogenase